MLARSPGSLIGAYRKMHKRGLFPGHSLAAHVPAITELVMASGAKTLLDYGCGGGKQYTEECYHVFWNIMPTLYDPAVPEFSRKPSGQFDGVISTDVCEHIPEDELDDVINEIAGYARKWAFISVCCRPAKANKNLPDGRNAHVTIKPPEWWQEKLGAALGERLHLAFTP